MGERGLVILPEGRFLKGAKLREEQALFFCVAGSGSGLFPGRPVYILPYAFMDGCVFKGEIVVILIIGIKIFKAAAAEADGADGFIFI